MAMELFQELKIELRNHGQFISECPDFPPEHVAYPNGYIVIKPTSVRGDSVPEYEAWYEEDGSEKLSDAPAINIFTKGGKFYAEVSEGLGGVAPGDFKNKFNTEQDLVVFITNYYFGKTNEFQSRVNS